MNQADGLVGIKRIQNYSYVLSEQIGRGYSSCVYKGKDDRTNELVAVKVVDHKKLEDQFHKDLLEQEIICLKELKHEQNILKILDVYSTVNNTYIITELCDTKDLAKLIRSKGKIGEQEAIGILKQLVNGYLNMQKHRIIHRDLKPMNIFFKNGVLKIADFGFAFKEGQPTTKYNLGSPSYMAPEVLRDNKYSFKSDIWALGVIAYEVLHGKIPWQSNTEMILLAFITKEAIETIASPEVKSKPVLLNFMRRCCNPIFQTRMTPEELAHYDWGTSRKPAQEPLMAPQQPSRTSRPRSIVLPNSSTPNPSTVPNKIHQHFSTIPSMQPTSQRDHPVSGILPDSFPTAVTISPVTSQPQQVLTQLGKQTQRSQQNLSMSDEGFSSVSLQAIVSQIHYCRFSKMIAASVQKMEESELKKELWQYFANEVIQKINLLFNMTIQQDNILQLRGFRSLLRSPDWLALKDIITRYRSKYMRFFNREIAHYNSSQMLIMKAIKILSGGTSHMDLLQQMVIFYQIKMMQKRIDYNEFGQSTKIQNVVMALEGAKTDVARLKSKVALLGLS